MHRTGDSNAYLNSIEKEIEDFAQSLLALGSILSSKPARACVPHFADILSKLTTTITALRHGPSIKLMSPDEFRKMFQGFVVPVDEMKYKDKTVKRMLNRFHRNTILALRTGEDPTGDGIKLWNTLQAQYCSILQRLETQWNALGLMSPTEARRLARQAALSVQITMASKSSRDDAMTVCTIGTKHGEVSFRLDGEAGSGVLSTFPSDPIERGMLLESLGTLLQSLYEGQQDGVGSSSSETGTAHSTNHMDDDSIVIGEFPAQRRKSA